MARFDLTDARVGSDRVAASDGRTRHGSGGRPAGTEPDLLAVVHECAGIAARYGPYTTCGNRFRRWRKRGIWDRLLAAVSKAYNGDLQMIDAISVRAHQHAA